MSEAMQCRYCGGFNVIIDIESGKLTCMDCPVHKQLPHRGKLIDLEEMKQKFIDAEEAEWQKAKQLGIEVKIDSGKNKRK